MVVDLEQGESSNINIYLDSDPEDLAYKFCSEHDLDKDSFEYLASEIKKIIENLTLTAKSRDSNNFYDCHNQQDHDKNGNSNDNDVNYKITEKTEENFQSGKNTHKENHGETNWKTNQEFELGNEYIKTIIETENNDRETLHSKDFELPEKYLNVNNNNAKNNDNGKTKYYMTEKKENHEDRHHKQTKLYNHLPNHTSSSKSKLKNHAREKAKEKNSKEIKTTNVIYKKKTIAAEIKPKKAAVKNDENDADDENIYSKLFKDAVRQS
jgi:hypothetical protein